MKLRRRPPAYLCYNLRIPIIRENSPETSGVFELLKEQASKWDWVEQSTAPIATFMFVYVFICFVCFLNCFCCSQWDMSLANSCAVAVVASNATVSNNMTDAVINAFDCHQVCSQFQHLKFDCTITTFVIGFRYQLRTELTCDVRFLTAAFVAFFTVSHPFFNHHLLRVSALFAVGSLSTVLAHTPPATVGT